MITDTRTAIQVGNSMAVTLPPGFVKVGEKLQLHIQEDVITIRPTKTSQQKRFATNDEVAQKFEELERRYGKLYNDLAHIQ